MTTDDILGRIKEESKGGFDCDRSEDKGHACLQDFPSSPKFWCYACTVNWLLLTAGNASYTAQLEFNGRMKALKKIAQIRYHVENCPYCQNAYDDHELNELLKIKQ